MCFHVQTGKGNNPLFVHLFEYVERRDGLSYHCHAPKAMSNVDLVSQPRNIPRMPLVVLQNHEIPENFANAETVKNVRILHNCYTVHQLEVLINRVNFCKSFEEWFLMEPDCQQYSLNYSKGTLNIHFVHLHRVFRQMYIIYYSWLLVNVVYAHEHCLGPM